MDSTLKHEIQCQMYQGETITFHPLFSETKIEELLKEFAQLLNEADSKNLEISQEMQIYLIQFLTIKHFTHFKKDFPSTLLGQTKKEAGLLDYLNHFRKTGLLRECLEDMFLLKEVQKVFNRLTDMAGASLLVIDLDKEMMRKFEQLKIKNADVFKELEKLNVDTVTDENKIVQ
jgi:hypothetical protein